jgi:SAM-dependent methyltransferase
MQAVSQCPVCSGQAFERFLTCTDHTVSHETFDLIRCIACNFVITSPRPPEHQLGTYYVSEDYHSHSRNSKGIFHNLYRLVRLFTLSWKVNIIKTNTPNQTSATILDFGCGTGEFLLECKKSGYNIQGVETSEIARQNAQEEVRKNISSTLQTINNSFDIITLWHVLEHLPDLNETITQLKTRLKENGTMFIAVPNHLSKDAIRYKQNWAGYDVPRHLWHFSESTLKELALKHGLAVEKIIPMKLDAFYVSMLSEKYLTGRQNTTTFIKGFLQGLKSNLSAWRSNQYSSLIFIIRK